LSAVLTSKLYLIGAGVSFPEHLTFQSVEVMKGCGQIFTNLPPAEWRKLPAILRDKTVGLWDDYKDERNRTLNYEDVAARIVSAIGEAPICFLTPGHPTIFDSVSQLLLDHCSAQGVPFTIVPAVSCIDTILAQLGFDPANGMYIFEATAAVSNDIALDARYSACLLQPSAFRSDLAHYSSEWMPDLRPLGEYVARYYGPANPCVYVRSLSQAGPSSLVWRTAETLHDVEFMDIAGSTLFVPATIA